MMEYFSLFPKEVINLILEFQGYHKNRNGKYMRQIQSNDWRYPILRKKPYNICYYTNPYGNFYRSIFYKNIQNGVYKIVIHSIDFYGRIHWYMNVLYFDGIIGQMPVWKKCSDKSVHYVYKL